MSFRGTTRWRRVFKIMRNRAFLLPFFLRPLERITRERDDVERDAIWIGLSNAVKPGFLAGRAFFTGTNLCPRSRGPTTSAPFVEDTR